MIGMMVQYFLDNPDDDDFQVIFHLTLNAQACEVIRTSHEHFVQVLVELTDV